MGEMYYCWYMKVDFVRMITGVVITLFGALFIVLSFSTHDNDAADDVILFVIGGIAFVIGAFILLNSGEDDIENIN